jgi:micrococcal nuclease
VILPDGRNFAEVMIAEGYGFEFTYRLPYRYRERFKAAGREARERQRGLWAPDACNGRQQVGRPSPRP